MSEQYFTRPNVQPVITYIGTTPEQRQMSTDEFKAKFDEMTVNLQNYIKETLLTELDAFKGDFLEHIDKYLALKTNFETHQAERASDDVHGLIDLVDNSECARFGISSNQSIGATSGAYVRVYLNQVVTNATFATIENGYVKFLKKGLYYLTFQGVFEASSESGFRQCVIGNAGNVLAFTRYPAALNVTHAQQVNLARRFDENELLEINVAMKNTEALNLLANDTFVTISRVGDL